MPTREELEEKARELQALLIAERIEKEKMGWWWHLDERQRQLVDNCITYASHEPAGLPGHNLMLIVAKMAELLNRVDPPEEKKLHAKQT